MVWWFVRRSRDQRATTSASASGESEESEESETTRLLEVEERRNGASMSPVRVVQWTVALVALLGIALVMRLMRDKILPLEEDNYTKELFINTTETTAATRLSFSKHIGFE